MFDRYSDAAKRDIYYSRYYAQQAGSARIDSHHILLGIAWQEKFTLSVFGLYSQWELLASKVSKKFPQGSCTDKEDLPLSNESKRILAYAAEEAEKLQHYSIEPEHLVLGCLREHSCAASELLVEIGFTLEPTRLKAQQLTPEKEPPPGYFHPAVVRRRRIFGWLNLLRPLVYLLFAVALSIAFFVFATRQ